MDSVVQFLGGVCGTDSEKWEESGLVIAIARSLNATDYKAAVYRERRIGLGNKVTMLKRQAIVQQYEQLLKSDRI